MKNNDPAVAKKAKDGLALLLEKEMPTIEKDTTTLCAALSDSDPFIRLQASAVFMTIVVAAPEHNQVVLSCIPNLITAAKDADDQTRNNSLFALALNPAGPPSSAHDVFVTSLKSSNFRTAEVAAAGLIRETTNIEANHKMVEKALEEAPDAKHRLNILYAISGSKVPSDTLFQASQRFIDDSNSDVQHAAIDAVAATGTDKSKVMTVMQNLEDSSSASMQEKKHAEAVLNSLKAQR
jgi:HEAT repeat protein